VGEDNTKFFHAMATQIYRKNNIASLKLESGKVITDHHHMAGFSLNKFRGRMGQAKGISVGFHLSTLLTPVEGLHVLTRPFEKEEMDLVIKHMAPDKSPGPDGFNGLFLKKCWNIISQDF
jgi:hypothetical protein